MKTRLMMATLAASWAWVSPLSANPATVAQQAAVRHLRAINCDLARGKHEGVTLDDRLRLRLEHREDGYCRSGECLSETIDLGEPGPISVQWIEQWTAPQRWKKHSANPIYGPGQSGAWDGWTNGVSVVRNPDGRSYKMFYCGRAGAGIGFAEAAIDLPLAWKENPASPVLIPRKDNWEGNLLNQPRVVKVTDRHWRMYYTGWGLRGIGGSNWAFGLAESFDAGVTWRRHDEDPLLERGPPGAPDDGGAFVPEVRRVGDRWMMWYTAMKDNPGKQNIHLCLATSDDGIHWKKCEQNPVLTDDFAKGPTRNVTSRCHVRYDDGVYRMWYSHAKPTYRIRYAESLDGIHWERSPIQFALEPSPKPAWDSQKVEYPEIDLADGQWRMWFCGNGFGTVGYAGGIVETGVRLALRSGSTAAPDASWSAWNPLERGVVIPSGRFLQIKAELWSQNSCLSPALNRVELRRRLGVSPEDGHGTGILPVHGRDTLVTPASGRMGREES